MGNRDENIRKALQYIEEEQMTITQRSSIIETDPVGGPPQNKYFNLVIEVETRLNPQELLKKLKSIESNLGRIKTVQDGPRPIDLDILLYGEEFINTPELTIPHSRMLKRSFVMNPLKEIAADIYQELVDARR